MTVLQRDATHSDHAEDREKGHGVNARSSEIASSTLPDVQKTSNAEPLRDFIEDALARALAEASAAGRFDVVAQLAREIETRRLAQENNVIAFGRRLQRSGGR
jgi:hypothetical protein